METIEILIRTRNGSAAIDIARAIDQGYANAARSVSMLNTQMRGLSALATPLNQVAQSAELLAQNSRGLNSFSRSINNAAEASVRLNQQSGGIRSFAASLSEAGRASTRLTDGNRGLNSYNRLIRQAADSTEVLARQGRGLDGLSRNIDDASRSAERLARQSRGLNGLGNTFRRAGDGVRDFRRELRASSSVLRTIQGLIGGLIAAEAIRGVVNLSDEYTNLRNRLGLVTDNQRELNIAQAEALRIGNETGQSQANIADLYFRTERATRNLGTTQEDVLQFTQNLNRAFVISGASGQQAASGVLQLGQALESGVAQGDEFRSISENIPVVLDLVAERLGVTREELRGLSRQSVITSQILFESIRDATDRINADFSRVEPTIARSLNAIRNNFRAAANEFLTGSGFSQGAARSLQFLADNLAGVSQVAGVTAVAIGVTLAQQALPRLSAAIARVNFAALLNPLTLIATGIAATSVLLFRFRDEIEVAADGTTLGDFGAESLVVFNEILDDTRSSIAEFLSTIERASVEIFGLSDSFTLNFSTLIDGAISAGDAVINFLIRPFLIGVETLNQGLPRLGNNLLDIASNIGLIDTDFRFELPETDFTTRLEEILEGPNLLDSFRDRVQDRLELRLELDQQLSTGINQPPERRQTPPPRLTDRQRRARERELMQAREFVMSLREEIRLLEFRGRELEVQQQLTEGRSAIRFGLISADDIRSLTERTQLLREERQVLDDILGPEEMRRNSLTALNTVYDGARISHFQYLQALENLDPIFAFQRQTEDEIDTLARTGQARTVYAQTLELQDQLGRRLTRTERDGVRTAVEALETARARADLIERLVPDQERYNTTQEALNQLLAEGTINQRMFNDESRRLRLEQLEQSNDISSGFEQGLIRIQQMTQVTGQTIADTLARGFDSGADALTDFLLTGEGSFSGFIDSLVRDFTRLVVNQAFQSALGAFGGGGGGGLGGLGGLVSGIGSIFGGFFGGGGGGGATGFTDLLASPSQFSFSPTLTASVAAPGAGGIATGVSVIGMGFGPGGASDGLSGLGFSGGDAGIMGFQTGVSARVGGSGGPDSQLFALALSPGELVDIRTPEQARRESQQSQATQQNFNITISLPNVQDSTGFNESQAGLAREIGRAIRAEENRTGS